jgi:hypothetical protein
MALPSLHMQELPKVDPTMKLFFLGGVLVSTTIVGRLFLTTCYLELTGLHHTSSQGRLSPELRIPHSLAITLWGIQKYGCVFTIAILVLMLRAIFGVFESTFEFKKSLRMWQKMGNPRAGIVKELGMNLGIQVVLGVTTFIFGGRHLLLILGGMMAVLWTMLKAARVEFEGGWNGQSGKAVVRGISWDCVWLVAGAMVFLCCV